MTVETFIYERYWPRIAPDYSPQWRAHTEYLIKFIVDGFGRHEMVDIPLEAVDEWWGALRRRFKTPVTPNKVLVRAKHIFKKAIRWKLVTENPFSDISKEKEDDHLFIPLTDLEHTTIFNDAGERLQWYMMFARYTGARRSSLAKLEERDIDLVKNTITFRDTKNGSTHSIHAHSALRPWCERAITGSPTRKALPTYVHIHSISQLFRQLLRRNGLSGFRFHDYRHNLGTKLAEKGYNVKVIMDILGHKDSRMSIKYTHIAKEVLASALEEAL